MRAIPFCLKFIAGFVSNLSCQTARAAINGISCLALITAATLASMFALMQIMSGGVSASHKYSSASCGMCAKAVKRGFAFSLQAAGVLTLLSPLARAAQACSESFIPKGVFVPVGASKNMWQEIFGLNSWDQEAQKNPPAMKVVEEVQNAPSPSVFIAAVEVATKETEEKSHIIEEIKIDAKRKKASKSAEGKEEKNWDVLVGEYLAATTRPQMDAIRIRMAVNHPIRYLTALAEAQRRLGRKSKAA